MMTRKLFAPTLLLALTRTARSLDMPLSQNLIDGARQVRAGAAEKPGLDLGAATLSRDGATRFTAGTTSARILAHPIRADGTFGSGVPDGPLRTRRGERGIDLTGLATDRGGTALRGHGDRPAGFRPPWAVGVAC
jgi:hypothetical protein